MTGKGAASEHLSVLKATRFSCYSKNESMKIQLYKWLFLAFIHLNFLQRGSPNKPSGLNHFKNFCTIKFRWFYHYCFFSAIFIAKIQWKYNFINDYFWLLYIWIFHSAIPVFTKWRRTELNGFYEMNQEGYNFMIKFLLKKLYFGMLLRHEVFNII